MPVMNLVTPKAAAKHELLFNKLASGRYAEQLPGAIHPKAGV
jgi:hypothetical protein